MSDLYDPEKHENISDPAEEEENVISVWHGSGNTRFFRRRYFDGFTFYETLDADGKRRTHSVYVGTWYTQQLTRRQRVSRRLLYFLLWLVSAAALVFGGTRVIFINSKAYGAAPAFAGLLGLGWMAMALFNECTVPQKRTIGDYRASSLGLQRSGLMIAICSWLTCLLTVIFGFIGGEKAGLHVLAAVCELVSGGAGLMVRQLERRVEFTQERSKDAGKYTM